MTKKILVINQEKCSGCRMCEIVCSYFNENEFNPALSRIQVISDKSKSIDFTIVCQQCEKALCQEVCISGAIYYDATIGAYKIDEKKCIGCKLCIISCPVGAMGFNTKNGVAMKCNLCDGEPKCVKYCFMEAIEFIEPEKVSIKKKIITVEKFLLSQKT